MAHLPFVEFGINTTLNVSTGCAPFELAYGVRPSLPVDLVLGTPATEHAASLEFGK